MPTTRAELMGLERDSDALALHIKNSQVLGEVPEIVWHFLSDADVRFKSSEYGQAQVADLATALAAMEQQGLAGSGVTHPNPTPESSA
jgi:hypothetical protein